MSLCKDKPVCMREGHGGREKGVRARARERERKKEREGEGERMQSQLGLKAEIHGD